MDPQTTPAIPAPRPRPPSPSLARAIKAAQWGLLQGVAQDNLAALERWIPALQSAFSLAFPQERPRSDAALLLAYQKAPRAPLFLGRLLQAGLFADILLPEQSPFAGFSLLQHAALAPRDRVWILEALLRSGANPELVGSQGRKPLSLAAGRANPRAVELLLERGCDPNEPDASGQTPLIHAMPSAHNGLPLECPERDLCVSLLLQAGADPNLRPEGGPSALHAALLAFHRPLALALIDAGAHTDFLLSPDPLLWPHTTQLAEFLKPFVEIAAAGAQKAQLEALLPPAAPPARPARALAL